MNVNANYGDSPGWASHQLLKSVFGEGQVETRAYGNSLIAAGEMRGMVADEFTTGTEITHDPISAVEICAVL